MTNLFKPSTIIFGDSLDKLKEIPNDTIDCIISSPPYYNQRDYSVSGQIGLEKNFLLYLENLKLIMDQLKRVLKKTGSCWINVNDSYSGSGHGAGTKNNTKQSFTFDKKPKCEELLAPKSLMGIPQRFFINCIDSGWLARNDCVWYKHNAQPSPVKDRFSNKYEPVYFFTKEPKYYFDLNAVREPYITESKKTNRRVTEDKLKQSDLFGKVEDSESEDSTKDNPNNPGQAQYRDRKRIARANGASHDNPFGSPLGKNPGDVLFINTVPSPYKHTATYPVALPLKILKCACPKQVCIKCGIPRYPISKPTTEYQKALDKGKWNGSGDLVNGSHISNNKDRTITATFETTGYTKCDCNDEFIPGIVLDPFFGTGTTAVAAEQLNLNWLGIELNEKYIEIAKKRIEEIVTKKRIELKQNQLSS